MYLPMAPEASAKLASDAEPLRARVEEILTRTFGRCEEHLYASGLIDSLRAIELGTLLEAEFGIPISELSVQDLVSVTTIVDKLQASTRLKK
jgi:acyl carrier protein